MAKPRFSIIGKSSVVGNGIWDNQVSRPVLLIPAGNFPPEVEQKLLVEALRIIQEEYGS